MEDATKHIFSAVIDCSSLMLPE